MTWASCALLFAACGLLGVAARSQDEIERLRRLADDLATQDRPDPKAVATALSELQVRLAARGTDAATLAPIAIDLANAALGTASEELALRSLLDVRRRAPGAVFGAFGHRVLADLAWTRGDLRTVSEAVRDGVRVAADDPRERALLWTDEMQLQCALGRLEAADRAGENARAAIAASRSAGVDTDAAAGAVGYALADLYMLAGDHAKAGEALQMIDARDPRRAFYGDLLRVLGPACTPADEQRLVDHSGNEHLDPQLRTFAAAKVVQAALRRGDVETAASRLPALEVLSPSTVGTHEGRAAMYAAEIALRRGEGLRATVPALETAFTNLLAKRRAAPPLAGGIGLLQIDDRATLVGTLMRTDTALATDGSGAWHALDRVIAAHAASLREPIAPPAARSLAQSLLGERHGLLVYVTGVFASLVLVVDRERAELVELPPITEVRPALAALAEAADAALHGSAPRGDAVAVAATTVADRLLPATVMKRLERWERLSVCGAGLLGNLPFELLPRRDGRRLGEVVAIDYVANLPGDAARAPARTSSRLLFAGALDRRPDEAASLRLDPRLVTACAAHYASDRRTVLLDDEVRRDALTPGFREAAVVHLVGHGELDWARTYEHGIVFRRGSEQGHLWGDHVVDLDLRGLVVLLSSCHAGTAPNRRGGDPLAASLAGALLTAGARCVLVPTSTVEIGRHLRAMAVVHEHLAKGEPLAVALYRARCAAKDNAGALLELLLVQVHGRGF